MLPLIVWSNGNDGKSQIRRKRSLDLFFLILLLLLALRATTVGRDLVAYETFFETISDLPMNDLIDLDMEIGYALLNKLISLFTNDFQWVIAIVAAISVIPMWMVYRRESEDAYLSIIVFLIMPVFAMMFSGLRQSIAFSIGFIAFNWVQKKKPLRFLLTVAIAFLFHKSALILLILYPLYYAKITKKWLFVVIPAMGVVFVFNKPIFAFLQDLISDLYSTEAQGNSAYTTLILFILFAVFAFVVMDEGKLKTDEFGLRNILLLAIVIQMFVPLHTLAMRLNYYFIVFVPLLVAKAIKKRSQRFNQIAVVAKYLMTVVFVGYFWYNLITRNTLDISPYLFFWEIR